MSDSIIICPNCGAANEHSGNCAFCGSPLPLKKGAKKNVNLANIPEVEGEYKVKIDERVLIQEYDKFTGQTTTRWRCIDKITYTHGIPLTEGNYPICFSIEHIHGKGKDFFTVFAKSPISTKSPICILHIDNRNYNLSSIPKTEIEELIRTLCEAKSLAIKIGADEIENAQVIIWLAQVFYHTFRNSTKYGDAADKLFYYYKDKIDKRNRDLIKKNRDLIEKKHKEKATRRKAIIVSILFSFLLVIGLMICFYVFFFVLDWIF